jgi:hypothetical protein
MLAHSLPSSNSGTVRLVLVYFFIEKNLQRFCNIVLVFILILIGSELHSEVTQASLKMDSSKIYYYEISVNLPSYRYSFYVG